MYNTMNNPSAHPSYSHYYLLSPSTLFFCFLFLYILLLLFFCTSCCFFAHLIVFCTSYCFLHILLFCTFYFIAHFILISPFLTICMPLCYVTYIICILIVLHCHWADLIRLHFTSSYALYNYYVTNKETLNLGSLRPFISSWISPPAGAGGEIARRPCQTVPGHCLSYQLPRRHALCILNHACRVPSSKDGPREDFVAFMEWILAWNGSRFFTVSSEDDLASSTPDSEPSPPSPHCAEPKPTATDEPSPYGATELRMAEESEVLVMSDQVRASYSTRHEGEGCGQRERREKLRPLHHGWGWAYCVDLGLLDCDLTLFLVNLIMPFKATLPPRLSHTHFFLACTEENSSLKLSI